MYFLKSSYKLILNVTLIFQHKYHLKHIFVVLFKSCNNYFVAAI